MENKDYDFERFFSDLTYEPIKPPRNWKPPYLPVKPGTWERITKSLLRLLLPVAPYSVWYAGWWNKDGTSEIVGLPPLNEQHPMWDVCYEFEFESPPPWVKDEDEEYGMFLEERGTFLGDEEWLRSEIQKDVVLWVIQDEWGATINILGNMYTSIREVDLERFPLEGRIVELFFKHLPQKYGYYLGASFGGLGRVDVYVYPGERFGLPHFLSLLHKLKENAPEGAPVFQDWRKLISTLEAEGYLDLSTDSIFEDKILKKPLSELIRRLLHGKIEYCIWCGNEIIKPWGKSGVYCQEKCYIRMRERIVKLNSGMPEIMDNNGNVVPLQKYMEAIYQAYMASGSPQAYREFWEKEAPRIEKETGCKLRSQYGYLPNIRRRKRNF